MQHEKPPKKSKLPDKSNHPLHSIRDPTAPAEMLHPVQIAQADPKCWPRRAPRKKKPAGRILQKIARRAGRISEQFDLIEKNDAILVALSGGKDSWTLVETLCHLKHHAPFRFRLAAVHLDLGFDRPPADTVDTSSAPPADATADANNETTASRKNPHAEMTGHLQALGIEAYLLSTDIGPRVHKMNRNGPDHPSHTNPCFLCSRFRRGVLYRLAPQLGFNKIALGHHADDLIETLLLNLFFSGQIKSMPPKLHSDDGRNTVVRPLAHVFESETAAYAARRNLPVLRSACRACAAPELSQRRWVKTLLSQIETKHPGTKGYLLAALSHVRPSHLLDRTLCDHNPATP